jgi:Deacetylase PdaC
MNDRAGRCILQVWIIVVTLVLLANDLEAQTAPTIYRGAVGGKHIEMRLNLSGNKVTGTYFYDQFKQDIKLEGAFDAKGQLELVEGSAKRPTGKFVCMKEKEIDVDLECQWSRPDGTKTLTAFLYEQGVRFKSDAKLVPKLLIDRKTKAEASYPQFVATTITPGMETLNRLIEERVQKAMKEFSSEGITSFSFETNYNVLFADEEKASIEFNEYSDVGAAHPNTQLWTINYNLKANKELSLEDIFKPGDEQNSAIATFVAKDINRRWEQLELADARRDNRQPEKRGEPFMEADQLPEMEGWAFSPKGVAVYFGFPHAMAVFTRTIVPYEVLRPYIRPDAVVPPVK